MKRPSSIAGMLGVLLVVQAVSSACQLIDAPDASKIRHGGEGSGGEAAGGGGGSGGAGGCVDAAVDCPASGSECVVATCDSGVCGTKPLPEGTPAATQTAGDCKLAWCDGSGQVVEVPDDVDVSDDTNECTDNACDQGSAVFPNVADGTSCSEGRVCLGGMCSDRTCIDGFEDGTETDVDCGGVCGPCGDGLGCGVGQDCASGVCADDGAGGLACQPAGCSDANMNGNETDVDCGGSCSPCGDGAVCNTNADCVSGICSANACQPASCSDNTLNGNETDVDCGGPCLPCGDNLGCVGGVDCLSKICGGGTCTPGSCLDGVENQDETDVDCGGAICGPCSPTQQCLQGTDCTSGVCPAGTCTAIEICNFADDDGDGDVDEGFDWSAGSWQNLFTTLQYASGARGVTLADGRLAIAGFDGQGASSDRGWLAAVDPNGTLTAGPLYTNIPLNGGSGVGIAVTNQGELAALYGSTNYAGCGGGCPVTLVRANAASFAPIGTTQINYPFATKHGGDLAWTPAGFVTLIWGGPATEAHLSWLDAGLGISKDVNLGGVPLSATLSAAGDNILWTDVLSGGPTKVRIGVHSAAAEILPPTVIASPTNGQGSTAAWWGGDLAVAWTEQNGGQYQSFVERRSTSGSTLAGPVAAGASGDSVWNLAVVGNTLVALVGVSPTLKVLRLRPDLQPISVPSPLTIGTTPLYHSLFALQSGLLIIRGTYSGKTVDAARVYCP